MQLALEGPETPHPYRGTISVRPPLSQWIVIPSRDPADAPGTRWHYRLTHRHTRAGAEVVYYRFEHAQPPV
jgi:hypothetical protein